MDTNHNRGCLVAMLQKMLRIWLKKREGKTLSPVNKMLTGDNMGRSIWLILNDMTPF